MTLSFGVVTYAPDPGFTGTATVDYTVCDNGTTAGHPDAKCAHGVLSIVTNRTPTAHDQSAGTSRNTPVTVTLAGTDPEDDALTFAIVTQPAHGTLAGAGDTRTYTPETGFSGSDSFTYTRRRRVRHLSARDRLDHRDRDAAADRAARRRRHDHEPARPDPSAGERHRGGGNARPDDTRDRHAADERHGRGRERRDPLHAGRRSHPGRSLHLPRVRHVRRLRRGCGHRCDRRAEPSAGRQAGQLRHRRRHDPPSGRAGRPGERHRPRSGRPHAGAARARRDERDAAAQQHRRVHLLAALLPGSTPSSTTSSTGRARSPTT